MTILLRIVAVFLLLLGTNAFAVDVNYKWDNGDKKIFANFNQNQVKDILAKFCNINNCKLEIDDNGKFLNKVVNGTYQFSSYTDYLNFLADKNNFDWLYYNGTLYVSSGNYDFSVLPVPPEYLGQIKSNLVSTGLYNQKFGWVVNSENSTILVSGPSKYVSLVHDFVQKFTPLPKGNDFIIVKLKYANANDINLNLSGQSYIIPGITTILTNITNPYIMMQNQAAFQTTPQSNILLKNTLDGYKSDPSVKSILGENKAGSGGDNASGGQSVLDSFPIVQSDVRTNSVVVFDKRANLPMYEKLIHYLDVPQKMLQVNTTVIDIDEDTFNSNGINWLANFQGTQFGFNTNNLATTNSSLMAATGQPSQTLLNATGLNSFIVNINELSQTGDAKIQSTPSVITLNDLPAIVSFNSQLFYYQQSAANNGSTPSTTGTSNVSPSQVNANSVIVITPHIMSDNAIRLEIMLQSQQLFDQDNTSTYPILNGGTIQTQAILSPSQGLILGGYDQEKKVKFVSQVPLLGDIPILGWFFKSEVIKTVKIKRAYLITINLVDPNKNATK